jgi:hypothetical protein
MRLAIKTETTPVKANPCPLGASDKKSISTPQENPFFTRKSSRNKEILSVSCLKNTLKLSSLNPLSKRE